MVAKNVIEILQKEGVLSKRVLPKLRDFERASGGNVLDFISNEHLASSGTVIPMLRNTYKIPVVDLTVEDIDLNTARLLPRDMCFEHVVVPFLANEREVAVAMDNPENSELIAFASQQLHRRVVPFLAQKSSIMQVLAAAFDQSAEDSRGQVQELIARVESFTGNPEAMAMEMPVVKLLNHLIAFALRSSASDLHIEPGDEYVTLRFRVDGLLHEMFRLPHSLLAPVIARIKILSHLRIDENLRPQDGRFTFSENGENVAIRVSIIPTLYGPKAALRFLDTNAASLSLDTVGLSIEDLATLRKAIGNTHGLVLVTGPTGSGKTTTLYALLNELQKKHMNLSTIEDPIEYHVSGVNQIQVNPQVGLTFSEGLRSILRQDPDIIMVGEIRDRETAQIAVNAALTGHLVLSSLHTNSASAAIARLIDMGIEPYLVASTLRAVVGQRLVRKLCASCTTITDVPVAFRDSVTSLAIGAGCERCLNTGHSGRTGIYETIVVDTRFHDAIMSRANAHDIETIAKKHGMKTIREHGLGKVSAHETSLEEVIRTTQ